MNPHVSDPAAPAADAQQGYAFGARSAWFAFAMTLALMIFDYVDRQVIVSLFPHMKTDWGLSDKQLGGLVSVVSITVALGALPVALFADRSGRVKSIVAMATVWSLATISCMWTRSYGALMTARALVGLGEAGYGSVGAALLASHFPARMRGAVMASFFAAASIGSVVGVMLGGVIATHWGWQAAFGVVGIPGLLVALAYTRVRDYKTVAMSPAMDAKRNSLVATIRHIASQLARTSTVRWVCIATAAQLITVSALWAWLPSFLNRMHGIAPAQAGVKAALVVLAGAVGSVIWGLVIDRAGLKQPRRKLLVLAALCLSSMAVLVVAFGLAPAPLQFPLAVLGGFLATCVSGPATAIVIDVVHPGARATGSAVLALFSNLFGLAAGPFLAGAVSDAWGLVTALTVMPLCSLIAAGGYLIAARSYESDKARVAGEVPAAADVPPLPAQRAAA